MNYEEVIDATSKIIDVLEKQGSDRLTQSLHDSVHMLKSNNDVKNTIEFLESMSTSAKGLKDIYVDSVSYEEWSRLIHDLANAIKVKKTRTPTE